MSRLRQILCLLFLAVFLAGVAGCSSTEPENASARPWNAPQTWESGLPAGMYQGR